jgi:hypothetical protein
VVVGGCGRPEHLRVWRMMKLGPARKSTALAASALLRMTDIR